MKTPEALIVTDQRSLFAYLAVSGCLPEIIKRVDFLCDSPTSTPLINPSENSCAGEFIASTILSILERYRPQSWGLAGPKGLLNDLMKILPQGCQSNLKTKIVKDVSEVNFLNVNDLFEDELLAVH